MSAGYVPGVPRLGVPALLMSDASLGVTNPGYREGNTATALLADIALGASFNLALAREAGGIRGFSTSLLPSGLNLFGALGKNPQPDVGNSGDCAGRVLEVPLSPLPTISAS